jgi:uncharacterized UBP type Zn finger protein
MTARNSLNHKENDMSCEHFTSLRAVEPSDLDGCHDCLRTGDDWVHLRMCMECGYVGCCDSSRNRHATRHHRLTTHPVIQGFEPGERWAFCYPHRKMLSDVGDTLARSYL